MPTRPDPPADKLEHLSRLLAEELPQGARLAICLDPEDVLLNEGEVVDAKGRGFRLLTYQEDDLAFRLRFREFAKSAAKPLLIRISTPQFAPLDHVINLSFIADIIAQSECLPIDLRTDAVISHYLKEITLPANFQQHAPSIGQNIAEFIEGHRRLRREIGRHQPLAEYQISAAFLMGKYPTLTYRDLDASDAYVPEIAARALGLAARLAMPEEDKRQLCEVLSATSQQANNAELQSWFALPHDEAAQLLTLADFLIAHQVANAGILLSSIGLFSRPIKELNVASVLPHLKSRLEDWQAICRLSDHTVSYETVLKTVRFLKGTSQTTNWIELVEDNTPACIAFALITEYLSQTFSNDEMSDLALPTALPEWAQPHMESWKTPHHDSPFDERATALLRMIHRIARVQQRLHESMSQTDSMDKLIANYTQTDDHRLELLLALARKDADACPTDELLERVDHFITRLEESVSKKLDILDRCTAEIINKNHASYRNHPLSSTKFMRSLASRMRTEQRLFVLLFDGMRWDTWVDVVRPTLESAFRVEEEKPLLTPVPTYTGFARTSFFAGAYPDSWRGIKGGFTYNEGELAAKNVGITRQDDYDQKVIFVTQTDSQAGTKRLRKEKPRRFNFLVFNISDDNIHDEQGDLREVNNAIRQKVETDVLPEMKRLVDPDDIVIISSDHGFIQLDRAQEVFVASRNENSPEVRRRYAIDRADLDDIGIVVPYSEKKNVQTTTCAVGRQWFNRNRNSGYTRYDHGGISLAEIVVPGVILQRAAEAEKLHLTIEAPQRLEVMEDDHFKIPVKVSNKGSQPVAVRITIGQRPAKLFEIGKNKEALHEIEMQANLSLKRLTVVVELRNKEGKFTPIQGGTRQIAVAVTERQDKIEFSNALDAFDDLD